MKILQGLLSVWHSLSGQRFRFIAESSFATVIQVNCSGVVQWVSPSLKAMLGWSPKDWIGRIVSDFVIAEDIDRLNANISKIISSGQPLTERYQVIAACGSIHWVETYAAVFLDSTKSCVGVVATFRTIDAEVKTERMLLLKSAELEKKLLASMTASSIAHELKQPLSLLLLKSNRLTKDCKSGAVPLAQVSSLSEEIEDLVQLMVDSTKAMDLVLGKMLNQSEAVDLSKILLEVIDSFAFSFDNTGIKLDGAGISHGIVVRGIKDALSIAIRNVLRNAIDELSSCVATDRLVLVTLERRPDSIELKIGDSGNGYSASSASTQLMNTTKSDGWGIGLSNVDCIMKCHSGRLSIGSSPLGGAELSLVFPPSPEL